jgi:hypothetical protein
MSTQIVKKYNNLFDSKIDLILCFGNVLEVKNADVLINPTGLVDLYLYMQIFYLRIIIYSNKRITIWSFKWLLKRNCKCIW